MNRFSVVESVRHLIDEYRSFIRSSYRLADPKLREQFEQHVNGAEVLVKGPYVTLAKDFAKGTSVRNLLDAGVGHPDLLRLNWPFGQSDLFAHQEDAMRAVDAGRNVIVKTGTGSGKTEAFLLPVLSAVMRMNAQGISGTKAVLLYPMNALANDQLVRLRDLIRNSGVAVTFALYTGDSQTVASALGEPLADHELTQREQIRRSPPDILLTNYKQLEFLLVRKSDRSLFSQSLRIAVLDEIHSYRGALATELACLLRRLKARCGLGAGQLRCIGTSATVSQDAGGDAALAKFASDLFAEAFSPEDIIGERYAPRPALLNPYLPPVVDVPADELSAFSHDQDEDILSLAERLCGRSAPATGNVHARVQALLKGNRIVEALNQVGETPRSQEELIAGLRERIPELGDVHATTLTRLIQAYLLIGSFGDDAAPPALRPKLHTFFHGVYDVGLCMNPACRTLIADGSDHCPACSSAVRPAVLCRTCGQDFVKVRFDEAQPGKIIANEEFQSDENTAFIAAKLIGESNSQDDEDDSGENAPTPASSRRRKPTAARQRMQQQWVDHVLGQIYEQRPTEVPADNLSLQHVLRGKASTCPVCNSRYNRGDVLTLLRTGVASSVSVLGTHHLDLMPDAERKLLVFADNRQDAAHQAGYMTDRHRQFALRHAIEFSVRESGISGIALQDIPKRVLETFQRIGLARRNLTRDELALWERTLDYETAAEFCRSAQQRVALENLALVEIQYEFLDQLVADQRFVNCCHQAGADVTAGATLVRAILDFMRRRRSVSYPFFQSFLDPSKTPWSWLTQEPYSLSVAEHERGAVFFMFNRPEALRSRPVSGIKFESIVKDTERGGLAGISKLVYEKCGLGAAKGEQWTRQVFELLLEKEILESPATLPETVRRHFGGKRALQVSRRVIRLVTAFNGWRCSKCSIWRPYLADSCLGSVGCSGHGTDIESTVVDRENYYVRLYTENRPRRLRAVEHTAQIDQERRAKLEQEFKEGRIEALVCSPTLELGVNIGSLFSVLLRNAPHGPANYVQRAGRAGRRHRIGFVTTFCGPGPHDRHCFEDPAWLVRGEYRPPNVRMTNDKIVERHVRSFVLEELNEDFSWLMKELLEDVQNPTQLKTDAYAPLLQSVRVRKSEMATRASEIFDGRAGVARVVEAFPEQFEQVVLDWHERVKRLHREFEEFTLIRPTFESRQRGLARQRAYAELTTDREKAFVLSYLSDVGMLPSYQFPTDTFSLDPGVGDTPTLRRPAWIALFEFAPGNMVYANGHKLKSIRAFFDGGSKSPTSIRDADQSGRVERFCFCDACGHASSDTSNNCPQCGKPIERQAEVALIESFEAEENTQITSTEDSRQRMYFERREHLLRQTTGNTTVYPHEFVAPEVRSQAQLLVTNWGRQAKWGGAGDQFSLCPLCGRHKPHSLAGKGAEKWDEGHQKFCTGVLRNYVLGYSFDADVLILPVAPGLAPDDALEAKAFCRTLGKALVVGAQELLEIEQDEIAYFHHPDGRGGWTLTFYETAAGGAGYLEQLAKNVGRWANAAHERLFKHDCEHACYRCLKSARNQFDHSLLDKELVRNTLFKLGHAQSTGDAHSGEPGDGRNASVAWLEANAPTSISDQYANTPIEVALLQAIRVGGRLPEPVAQYEIREDSGVRLTVPDFAYPEKKIAIYCDGFAYHGNRDALEGDARRRNQIQSQGWRVLAFWGRQILQYPEACETQVWQCHGH
jgi:ATP-dependent helicase YprA (DUF1998 family)/very-short-patch-repair endonuclease